MATLQGKKKIFCISNVKWPSLIEFCISTNISINRIALICLTEVSNK